MSTMMIAERSSSGHRLVYVRLLAEHAMRNQVDVILAMPDAVRGSLEYSRHLGRMARLVEHVSISPSASLVHLQGLAESSGARDLVIPDGDLYVAEAAYARRRPRSRTPRARTTLLIMRDPRWELSASRVPRWRALAKLAALRLVQVRSDTRLVWLRDPGFIPRVDEEEAPDPLVLDAPREAIIGDARSYRIVHGLDRDTFWFGIVGMLTERKNVPIVAEAVRRVAFDSATPLGLALIGPTGPDATWERAALQKECESAGVRFVSDEALMSNYEMNVAVAAVDCVVVAYSTHAPNSTMSKAAGLGVRLVVAGSPPMRRFAQSVSGTRGVPLDLRSLTAALRAATKAGPPRVRDLAGPSEFAAAVLGAAHSPTDASA